MWVGPSSSSRAARPTVPEPHAGGTTEDADAAKVDDASPTPTPLPRPIADDPVDDDPKNSDDDDDAAPTGASASSSASA